MNLSEAYKSLLGCKVGITCLPVMFTMNKLSQIINVEHKKYYKCVNKQNI